MTALLANEPLPALTFDQAAHVYYWHGRPVPNVTRIIAPLTDYSRIPPDVLERARQEGMAIHRMVELDCKDDLDLEALPAWMRPHHEAWCRFKAEAGFEPIAVEQPMYHPTLGYAGTPDLIGRAPRLKGVKGPLLIDVKRSFFAGPAIGLQTAAYTVLWNDTEGQTAGRVPTNNRFGLQLRDDGSYRLEHYADDEDFVAFLACLQQYRWRAKHYPTKETAYGSA